jgi:hypothetical protein
MRSAGRSPSGGSALDGGRRDEIRATTSAGEEAEGAEPGTQSVACKVNLRVERSGVVAVSGEATGQPSQHGASPAPTIPAAVEATEPYLSALSRPQIRTQDANAQKRQSGINAAATRPSLLGCLCITESITNGRLP